MALRHISLKVHDCDVDEDARGHQVYVFVEKIARIVDYGKGGCEIFQSGVPSVFVEENYDDIMDKIEDAIDFEDEEDDEDYEDDRSPSEDN